MRKVSHRNRIAFFLSLISGLMLIISGTTGVSSWKRIQEFTLSIINVPLIQKAFVLVLILASLGGLTVIIGGFFIKKNFVRVGKMLLLIGSGFGIISLMVNLYTTISNDGLSLAILFSLAPLGVLLAFAAQIIAKNSTY